MCTRKSGHPPIRCSGRWSARSHRLAGIRPEVETSWQAYALALLIFNGLGLAVIFALQLVQDRLPLNPGAVGPVAPDLAFNTAVSFASNTNWQSYSGETTLSYLTQMVGLTVQNFLSAATGMAVLVALVRGLARRSAQTVGNFWIDLVRGTLYILLPLSVLLALALVSQGVVQTLSPYKSIPLLEPTVMTLAAPSLSRCLLWGRQPRRWRSSSLAPTAADSSA